MSRPSPTSAAAAANDPERPRRAGEKRSADESVAGIEEAASAADGVGGLIASMNRMFDFQAEDALAAASDTDSELDDYGSSCGDSDGGGGGGPDARTTEGLEQMIADKRQRALRQEMQSLRKQQQPQPQQPPPRPPPPSAAAAAASAQQAQKSAQLASGEDFDL